MQEPIFFADLYLRLSKEDGDKDESESISNQKALLIDYAATIPNLKIHKIRIDDGYSGVNFNRPAFNEMIEDIHAGKVNCVIVKDFSRFGRNYIETGKYIQVMFPRLGVRFIAVGDAYDSTKEQGFLNNIIVPFKNIVNDAYCADISTKVRSHLEIKRKKGDFVGAFATYGYLKDKNNRNLLLVDSFAADVVRDIFMWKLNGLSALGIAEKLNESGIMSPMEHKRYHGLRYSTSFKINESAKWQAKSVLRILTNEIYTGVLEQGKRTTPNYKVHKCINIPKEKWTRVENAHESIIERSIFNTVQELLKHNIRAPQKNTNALPLSGLIFCADCGALMIYKSNTHSGKKYGYYVCSAHRKNKNICSTHIINANSCEKAVLSALQIHIASVLDNEYVTQNAIKLKHAKNQQKLSTRVKLKKDEMKKNINYKRSLYNSYQEGVITYDDFISYKTNYDTKIKKAELIINTLEKEILNHDLPNHEWMDIFNSFLISKELNRKMLVNFIKKINVYEKGKVEIFFRFKNEYENV